MLAEIRVYTANLGEMDEFIEHFDKNVIRLFEYLDVPIIGAWVNRDRNEFTWIRLYKDEADKEAKDEAYRKAVEEGRHVPGKNIAKVDTSMCEVLYEDKLPYSWKSE